MKILGYIWSAPTTLACLILWFLPLLILGQVRLTRWSAWGVLDWEARGWLLNHARSGGWLAVTLGWCILWYGPVTIKDRRHEMRHVAQNFVFGPLFLPLYLLGGLFGAFSGDAYWRNPFEVDARAHEED